MNLVVECFESHLIFLKAMKDAFEVFVNQQFGRSSTAVLFANYSDSLLSQSGMGSRMMEDDIENTLDKLVMLFAHLSEKDKFQEFAQKQLAKRLLFEKSLGEGVERYVCVCASPRCFPFGSPPIPFYFPPPSFDVAQSNFFGSLDRSRRVAI